MAVEAYSIVTDFTGLTAPAPDLGDLDYEIGASAITEPYSGSWMKGDAVEFTFDNPLGAPDKAILDSIVSGHTGEVRDLILGGAASIDLVATDLESGEGAGVRIGETTWQPLLHHIWRGSARLGTPVAIKIVARAEGGAGRQVDVRIVDLTNGSAVIASVFTESTSFIVIDMGALSNISRDSALWELQGMRTSGGGQRDGRISVVSIQF